MPETSKYLFFRPISQHLLPSSAILTLIFLLGTRVFRQQPILLSNRIHPPRGRKGSNIGRISCIIWRNQRQTSGNTPISESRYRPTSQRCQADSWHPRRSGRQAPRSDWRGTNSCSLHWEPSNSNSQGSEATCQSSSARGDYQSKGQIQSSCGVSLWWDQVPE